MWLSLPTTDNFLMGLGKKANQVGQQGLQQRQPQAGSMPGIARMPVGSSHE
jgi:hypothetical protein